MIYIFFFFLKWQLFCVGVCGNLWQFWFALELGKVAEIDFVYTLASTNMKQSVPNVVKMNTAIRSQMILIMDVIRPELSKLSALELEKLPYLTLFTL